jgi:deoxyribose-phosphate aldolase
MAPRPGELAKALELTVLRANAVPADLEAAALEARERHVAALCVLPAHVGQLAAALAGSDVKLVALISFPFGADVPDVKRRAAEAALADGADDVEVMFALPTFLAGDVNAVRDELAAIRKALQLRTMSSGRRPPQLRAVVETSYLDDRRIRLAARVVRAAGVDMVVTSTGLGPRSASPLDVELLHEELGSAVPIKTAGGVRTADEVAELLAAGARRVGVASAAGVLDPVVRR